MPREEPDGPELPQEIEEELMSLFELPRREQPERIESLCERHREHAAAIYARIRKLRYEDAARSGSKVPPPLEQAGPYRILGLLGEGGMGTVYMAEQREPVRRRVAIKVIKLGMDSKAILARFEAERQALAMMEHRGIARIFDCGITEHGQSYFAMELVKGMPITKYCDDNKLGIRARLELFLEVCAAVQHAHNKGIIHRDLTPNNILITVQDDQPCVKIIDFGLARATDHRLTEATIYTEHGQVVGTPEYMSPEQAGLQGLDIDTRTDIYTLGVLLYELLVGELPISREELCKGSLEEMQRMIREVEPAKPSTRITTGAGAATAMHAKERRTDPKGLLNGVRGELDWVVMKALEKDRTRRYLTPTEFGRDVERFLRHEPVDAGPPSMMYVARKLTRRYWKAASVAALILVVLTVGIISSTFFMYEARAESKRAERLKTVAEKEARIAKGPLIRIKIADAEKRARKLLRQWPPDTGALREWLAEQDRLRKEISSMQQLRQLVRSRGGAVEAAQRQEWAQAHPRLAHLAALQRRRKSYEQADRVRLGQKLAPYSLEGERLPPKLEDLSKFAWSLVNPDRALQAHGFERKGLALARRALEVAKSEGRTSLSVYHDTLAWALFANGRFRAAVDAMDKARDLAPNEKKVDYRTLRARLGRLIRDFPTRLRRFAAEVARLEAEVQGPDTRFASEEDELLYRSLGTALEELTGFFDEDGVVERMAYRAQFSERLREVQTKYASRWSEVQQDLLSPASGPYAGLKIRFLPQLGLVPIGKSKFGLWEFYHLRSAADVGLDDPRAFEIPAPDSDGRVQMDESTGIVLVLLPGGDAQVGAQGETPGAPGYDEFAAGNEGPVQKARVAPFLVSKYELTQGQWMRLARGENPSYTSAGEAIHAGVVSLAHPVEQVSWQASTTLVGPHGLRLPTLAEWEFACRAGTSTRYFTGSEPESLGLHANILDEFVAEKVPEWVGDKKVFFNDGAVVHAPVGSYRPNGYGLYDMLGNVGEQTADRDDRGRSFACGGSYIDSFEHCRVTSRYVNSPGTTRGLIGLRVAASLETVGSK